MSTKEIAAAAGVAEGTIFRAFGAKQDLIDAALEAALDPADFITSLDAIDGSAPLQARLTDAVLLIQARMTETHHLMATMGITGAPPAKHACAWHDATLAALTRLIGHEPSLRVTPASVAHLLRMITFATSHPYLGSAHGMDAAQVVDVLLHGVTHADAEASRIATDGTDTTPEPVPEREKS